MSATHGLEPAVGLLPDRRRVGHGWEPAVPLIFAAWWESPGLAKNLRFLEHLEWAKNMVVWGWLIPTYGHSVKANGFTLEIRRDAVARAGVSPGSCEKLRSKFGFHSVIA